MNGPTPAGGTPERVAVDGILDGRVLNEQRLRAAAAALGGCGAGTFQLEIQGPRFSLLPDEGAPDGRDFDVAAQATFLDRLQELVDAAEPGSVETTLRCTLVHRDDVAETLFAVQGANVSPITRRRPRTERDTPPPRHGTDRRRQLLLLAPLLVLAAGLVAWQIGLVDQLLSPDASELTRDVGPFDGMLRIDDVERAGLGGYRIAITRGPDYPRTPQEIEQRRAEFTDVARLKAWDVVGSGDHLFAQLRDEQNAPLFAARIDLRALLLQPDARVLVDLPGHRSAASVALSLQGGTAGR